VTEREANLYGCGRILRFVSEGLADRSGDRLAPPLTLLIGPRGSGKTVLLDRLEADHRTASPTARFDFGLSADASPLDVMLGIGFGLNQRVARVGKVRLPLLGVALIALSLDPDAMASPTQQLEQRLSGWPSARMLADLATNVSKLAPPEYQPLGDEAGQAVAWVVNAISRRRIGEYLAWYASNVSRGNGTRFGPLLQIYEWWQAARAYDDANARGELWRALCAALLADLRDGFNKAGLWHGNRTTNCLLLLDNAESDAGSEFLETLAECRQLVPGQPDPLLVVAALGRNPEVVPPAGPPVEPADEELSYAAWLVAARKQGENRSPWYPVSLADLSIDNVRPMVVSRVLGKAWRDADFVHDVGGGSPLAVAELAGRLAQAGSTFDPRQMLNREAEDHLLDALLPARLGDSELTAMTAFCAACRPTLRAGASVFRSLRLTGASELDTRDLLLSLMWAREERWIVIGRLPRLLLSRLLARDLETWGATHDAFLAHYRTQAARDPVAEQYHLLALTTSLAAGNLGKVAAYLDASLDSQKASDWNGELTAITAAPNRLRTTDDERLRTGGPPDFGGEIEDVVKRLADVTAAGQRLRTVTRLVAALWLSGDRFLDPSRRLARLVAHEYFELAQHTRGDSEVFYREGSHFRKIAHDWEDR
jgi:hypothetical protein